MDFYKANMKKTKRLHDINFNYENEAMRVLDSENAFEQQEREMMMVKCPQQNHAPFLMNLWLVIG